MLLAPKKVSAWASVLGPWFLLPSLAWLFSQHFCSILCLSATNNMSLTPGLSSTHQQPKKRLTGWEHVKRVRGQITLQYLESPVESLEPRGEVVWISPWHSPLRTSLSASRLPFYQDSKQKVSFLYSLSCGNLFIPLFLSSISGQTATGNPSYPPPFAVYVNWKAATCFSWMQELALVHS